MFAIRFPHPRWTFWLKVLLAVGLVVLADVLFDGMVLPGTTIGAFALAWTLAVLVASPAVRRDVRARAAIGAAAAFALVQIESPGLIAWSLFWAALAMASLLPRTGRFGDAFGWLLRLATHAAVAVTRPVRDARRVGRRLPKSARGQWRTLGLALILPVVGGAVFLALFAAANPIISEALRNARGPTLSISLIARAVFWSAVLVAVWATLRPRLWKPRKVARVVPSRPIEARVSVTSTTLSLIVFNAVFLLQNGLDAVYLWGHAGLPDGMSLAEYAHRGAYPLIATALLAGLFVLVVLKPGTETAARPLIRRLVVLWIAQNLFLVASTALRTLEYVDAYSLTRMRISALLWMALVAVGLILICWRLLRGRSAAWLINANALAAILVLSASTIVDLGAVAAAWNVRHAQEVGGRGAAIDLHYLQSLGASATVSLAELERTLPPSDLKRAVSAVRRRSQYDLAAAQADWRRWTWRGARRLERARSLTPLAEERSAVVRTAPAAPRADPATRPATPAGPALDPTPTRETLQADGRLTDTMQP